MVDWQGSLQHTQTSRSPIVANVEAASKPRPIHFLEGSVRIVTNGRDGRRVALCVPQPQRDWATIASRIGCPR